MTLEIKIAGKNIELGDALQQRIAEGLEAAVSKYFQRTGDAHVTVTKEGHSMEVDLNVHLPSGIILQSQGQASDPYAALESALDKMEKRVRRYKRRLKDHHRPDRTPLPSEPAASFVLQPGDDEEVGAETEGPRPNGADYPVIVAESDARIRTMTVSEAVMQLELSEGPALMFRNARHNGLNMVYRRSDGHIGWVDPAGTDNA